MNHNLTYRAMKPGDEGQVSAFISRVFHRYVAQDFSPQGVAEFLGYIHPEALADLLARNHAGVIATMASDIAGVIFLREGNHVALFFVDGPYQRTGIGRELLRRALGASGRREINASRVTVNASRNSVRAYRKLNFYPTGTEQCVNGIRFIPMTLNVKPEKP